MPQVANHQAATTIARRLFATPTREQAGTTQRLRGSCNSYVCPGVQLLQSPLLLAAMPAPLARYLRYSGAVGQKRISSLRLQHAGTFKPGANKAWMPIEGEYYITTKKPSFPGTAN